VRQKKHVLVIRFTTIDDVAVLVPIVHAVAVKYPDIRITVLSRGPSRKLFENLAPNINFMEANLKEEYHGIKGLNALYRRLVAKQFTHVADMQSIIRSLFLRLRFNLGRFRVEHISKRSLKNKQSVESSTVPSLAEEYTKVFAKLGFPIDDYQTE